MLRRFFEVDRHHITVAALQVLAQVGDVPAGMVAAAITRYGLNPEALPSWKV
jgi:pyruvate dehydrogenase E1 component